MKKSFLLVLSLLIISLTADIAFASSNGEVMDGIALYKSRNFTECYSKMTGLIEKDPSNALAYYYLAMSAAQIGKKEEAIDNYEKVLMLTSENSNLGRYAHKGKICLESPEMCDSVSISPSTGEGFIMSQTGPKFSEEVKTQIEQLKREELMRDINRNETIDPARFKEYRDFSSMNLEQGAPSNDEIVAALRTLQRAGLGNVFNNTQSDLSMLTGMGQQNPMFNMLGGNSSLSPQVIQALLTNNMSQGF